MRPGRRWSTAPAWLWTRPAPWDGPGHPGTPAGQTQASNELAEVFQRSKSSGAPTDLFYHHINKSETSSAVPVLPGHKASSPETLAAGFHHHEGAIKNPLGVWTARRRRDVLPEALPPSRALGQYPTAVACTDVGLSPLVIHQICYSPLFCSRIPLTRISEVLHNYGARDLVTFAEWDTEGDGRRSHIVTRWCLMKD